MVFFLRKLELDKTVASFCLEASESTYLELKESRDRHTGLMHFWDLANVEWASSCPDNHSQRQWLVDLVVGRLTQQADTEQNRERGHGMYYYTKENA